MATHANQSGPIRNDTGATCTILLLMQTLARAPLRATYVLPSSSQANFVYLHFDHQAFRHFDTRRKAKVSESDLSDGLRRLGLELTTRQERALFEAMGKTASLDTQTYDGQRSVKRR